MSHHNPTLPGQSNKKRKFSQPQYSDPSPREGSAEAPQEYRSTSERVQQRDISLQSRGRPGAYQEENKRAFLGNGENTYRPSYSKGTRDDRYSTLEEGNFTSNSWQ